MTSESRTKGLNETIDLLETQLREQIDAQAALRLEVEQLRRQIQFVAEQSETAERAVGQIDPKLQPYKGLPDKLQGLTEDAEHIRQAVTSARADFENALRMREAEARYDRQEVAELSKRVDGLTTRLGASDAELARLTNQLQQVTQALNVMPEQQHEIEERVDQQALRLERILEVNRDLEARIVAELSAQQDERFEVVSERLHVLGEMMKRIEARNEELSVEQTLRDDILQEIGLWRDEQARIDTRMASAEAAVERLLHSVDALHNETTLIEGRHSGLSERVASIRRDMAEIVDQVRDEFAKFNQLQEKQRRKQIQGLEQELREMKFHAFRPPQEP